jgi:hypothetical protein
MLMHNMRISINSISSVVLRPKKLEVQKQKHVKTVKEQEKNSMICHETEPNLSKDRSMHDWYNPLFWNEVIKFTFLKLEYIYC